VTSIAARFEELHPTSARLAERARQVFPDGVTHEIRHNVPFPVYVASAQGGRKYDVDGNELVDYVMGHGALLLGHGHPAITEAVTRQLARGTHYGASHEQEIAWGEWVQRLVPSAEKLRFTSSGTEATMMALRLARAATGRPRVLRLREHFHGWNDSVTGQPPTEGTLPRAPGLPQGTLEASIVVPQDDAIVLQRTLDDHSDEIAAVIFEATGAHWGTTPIDLGYVRRLRAETAARGIVLVFDEVITGFRVAPGGAQEVYGITPDVTTLAKIVAGGLPGGCVAGRAEIIERIAIGDRATREEARDERIAHPGTFNANPLSATAGATMLSLIADGAAQRRASDTAAAIARDMNSVLREESVVGAVYGQASMLHIALGMDRQPPDGYSWGWTSLPAPPPRVPVEVGQALRLGMLNEGIDLMSGGLMVSAVHGEDDVDRTVSAFRATLGAMKDERLL